MLSMNSIPENTSATPSLIQKATMYINSNFNKDISLKTLAANLFVSPKYLGALFEKSTGNKFHTYLNKVRLKHACHCLCTSNKSINEIEFESGYNSTEHFIYTFKKIMKMTPSQYRKSDKNTTPISVFNSTTL